MTEEYLTITDQEKIIKQLEKGVYCPNCYSKNSSNLMFYPCYAEKKRLYGDVNSAMPSFL